MGASQLKQYQLKHPLISLPGGYSFLRISKGIHPQTKNKVNLFIIKKPHKLLNPLVESEFPLFSEIKEHQQYILALTEQQVESLFLVHYQKRTIELKMVFKIMIEKPAELGRYFKVRGKFKLWCQERRGFESLSPEQVQENRSYENSKVFCSGISFLNFLSYCVEKSKTGFFEPKNKQQYLTLINEILIKLETTDFWHILDSKLKQLIKQMIELDAKNRISYKQLIKHEYICDPIIDTYYDLCELYHYATAKQLQFLKYLQKNLYKFQTFILKKYFIPILVSYLKIASISHLVVSCLVEALNRSNLIETQYFQSVILVNIIKLLKNSPTINTVYNLLEKAQHWSNYIGNKQFQQYFATMLIKAYESKSIQLASIAIKKTQFFLDRLVEINYKNQIENQLLGLIGISTEQIIRTSALKCIYTLLKSKKLVNFTKIHKNLVNIESQNQITNLHILKIYGLLIDELPPNQLLQTFSPSLSKHLNNTATRNEFEYSHKLYQQILQKISCWYDSNPYGRRSISSNQDFENQQYFILKREVGSYQQVDQEDSQLEFNYFNKTFKKQKKEEELTQMQIGKITEQEEYKVSEDFGKCNFEQE